MLLTDEDLIDYLRRVNRPGLTVAELAAGLEQKLADRRWVTKCPALPPPGCEWRAGPLPDCEAVRDLQRQHLAEDHPGVVPHYAAGGVAAAEVWGE